VQCKQGGYQAKMAVPITEDSGTVVGRKLLYLLVFVAFLPPPEAAMASRVAFPGTGKVFVPRACALAKKEGPPFRGPGML
jgi:hypothetical protein